MIENLLQILMLHFIIVYVVDIALFFDSINIRFKPFNCSSCMNVWCVSIYSFIWLNIGLVESFFIGCLMSYVSMFTSVILMKIIEFIESKL